jgi:hypothetical protein
MDRSAPDIWYHRMRSASTAHVVDSGCDRSAASSQNESCAAHAVPVLDSGCLLPSVGEAPLSVGADGMQHGCCGSPSLVQSFAPCAQHAVATHGLCMDWNAWSCILHATDVHACSSSYELDLSDLLCLSIAFGAVVLAASSLVDSAAYCDRSDVALRLALCYVRRAQPSAQHDAADTARPPGCFSMFQNLAEQCIQQCIQQLRQPLRGSCEPELLAPCSLLCSLLVSRPSPLPHHLQSTTRAIRPDGHATFGLYKMCSAFFVAAAVLTVAGPFTDATPAAAELASSILTSTMARLVFLLLVSAALAPAAITPATIAVAPLSPLTTELRSHEGASNSCTFTLAGSYLRGGAVNYILAAILLNLPLASASNGPPSVNQMPSLSVLMAVASAVPAALRTRSRLLSICSPARSILHYFCRCCCCRYPAHPTLSASLLSPLPARSASLALSATPRFAGRGGGGVKGANANVTTSGEGATSCVMASTVVAGHYTTDE